MVNHLLYFRFRKDHKILIIKSLMDVALYFMMLFLILTVNGLFPELKIMRKKIYCPSTALKNKELLWKSPLLSRKQAIILKEMVVFSDCGIDKLEEKLEGYYSTLTKKKVNIVRPMMNEILDQDLYSHVYYGDVLYSEAFTSALFVKYRLPLLMRWVNNEGIGSNIMVFMLSLIQKPTKILCDSYHYKKILVRLSLTMYMVGHHFLIIKSFNYSVMGLNLGIPVVLFHSLQYVRTWLVYLCMTDVIRIRVVCNSLSPCGYSDSRCRSVMAYSIDQFLTGRSRTLVKLNSLTESVIHEYVFIQQYRDSYIESTYLASAIKFWVSALTSLSSMWGDQQTIVNEYRELCQSYLAPDQSYARGQNKNFYIKYYTLYHWIHKVLRATPVLLVKFIMRERVNYFQVLSPFFLILTYLTIKDCLSNINPAELNRKMYMRTFKLCLLMASYVMGESKSTKLQVKLMGLCYRFLPVFTFRGFLIEKVLSYIAYLSSPELWVESYDWVNLPFIS